MYVLYVMIQLAIACDSEGLMADGILVIIEDI